MILMKFYLIILQIWIQQRKHHKCLGTLFKFVKPFFYCFFEHNKVASPVNLTDWNHESLKVSLFSP